VIDVNDYQCHIVLGRDEHSLVARTCLQRPSDGRFAVGFVERIPFEGDEEKCIEDLVTPWHELNFTTEDAASWSWWPTLREAIDESKVTFAPFESWSSNASN
jgi:hypothetical protein